jgi:hypothetical protein
MSRDDDKYPVYSFDNLIYVPFHSVHLAGGIFFPESTDSIVEYAELPPENDFCLHIRDQCNGSVRTHRPDLASVRIYGDSMIDKNILNNDIVVFARDFPYLENNRILVVEKLGQEEGFGAWSLKKLVIERLRSTGRTEFGDEIDLESPIVKLHSCNRQISPIELERSGQYKVRGIYLRSLLLHEVNFVESEVIRRRAKVRNEIRVTSVP